MNLAILKKTRRAPQVGDIFVMLPPDGQFLYGRVISNDASGPMGVGCELIYIYQVRSITKMPMPELLCTELLIPPIMTNKLPWSKGYFEFVENRLLTTTDRLSQHCFQDTRGWYFDEHGMRLHRFVHPVGSWGLDSYRTIDDKISEALGIPLAPD